MARKVNQLQSPEENFGEGLRKARTREGLSQAALAKKLGVTQPTIGNWEKAPVEPAKFKRVQKEFEKVFGSRTSQQRIDGQQSAPSPSDFGKWVQEQRIVKNMSVFELAQVADLTAPAIYNIEAGKSLNPQATTRNKLTAALGVVVPPEIIKDVEAESKIAGLGNLTSFDPHSKLSDLPDRPGIYVLYDISERPVYVGRSSSIAKRLNGSHREKFWYKAPIVSNGSFIEVRDAALRLQLEQILIKFLKSNVVLNKQSIESFEDD